MIELLTSHPRMQEQLQQLVSGQITTDISAVPSSILDHAEYYSQYELIFWLKIRGAVNVNPDYQQEAYPVMPLHDEQGVLLTAEKLADLSFEMLRESVTSALCVAFGGDAWENGKMREADAIAMLGQWVRQLHLAFPSEGEVEAMEVEEQESVGTAIDVIVSYLDRVRSV